MDDTKSNKIGAAGIVSIVAIVLALIGITIAIVAIFYPSQATTFTSPVNLNAGFTSASNSFITGSTLTVENLVANGTSNLLGSINSSNPAIIPSVQFLNDGDSALTLTPLSYYQEDTFMCNTTGAVTLSGVVFRITRIGNVVHLSGDANYNNPSAGGLITCTVSLALSYIPPTTRTYVILGSNGSSTVVLQTIQLNVASSSGIITFSLLNNVSFSVQASDATGWAAFDVEWIL